MQCAPGILCKEIHIRYNPSWWMAWDEIQIFVRSACNDPFLGHKVATIESRRNYEVNIVLNHIIDTSVQPAKYPPNFPLLRFADSDQFYNSEFCRWVYKEAQKSDFCLIAQFPSDGSSSNSVAQASTHIRSRPTTEIRSQPTTQIPSQSISQNHSPFTTRTQTQSATESLTILSPSPEPSFQSLGDNELDDTLLGLSSDWSCGESNKVTNLNHQSMGVDSNIKDPKYYHIKLVLKASSNYVTERVIRPAKTLIELCAEIGGHLGLFVGVSVLTLVELLEFFCKMARSFCRTSMEKNLVQAI